MEHTGVAHKIKECMANLVNNKSQADMATLHPDKSGKLSVKLQMFYNKHFPTDQNSYAVRLPAVSLALSLCAIQIFINLQWTDYIGSKIFYLGAIIVIISASTYGLYYGITIGDRKQFTPWIVVKILETIGTIVAVMNALISRRFMYGDRLANVFIGFGVIAANLLLLSIISRRRRDDLPDVNENADEFSPINTV